MLRNLSFFVVVILLKSFIKFSSVLCAENVIDAETCPLKLIPKIKPTEYILEFIPNPIEGFVNSSAIIKFIALETTKNFELHSLVDIQDIQLKDYKNKCNIDLTYKTSNVTEKVFIHLTNENIIQNENYEIYLKFISTIQAENGIRYSHEDYDNQKFIISTFFEPTAARKGFPCIDDPSYKATFTLKMYRNLNYRTYFNMPIKETIIITNSSTEDDYQMKTGTWDIYTTTPIMSTYLFAFVITNLDFVEIQSDRNNTAISTVTEVFRALHAAKYGSLAMVALENYTEINYVLPKMDHILLPKYFAGAVEHWGMITYIGIKSDYRFVDILTNLEERQLFGTVVHEITHQWFGNLVTCSHWRYLWLNEALTTFVSHKMVDKIKPSWNAKEVELTLLYQSAMLLLDYKIPESLTRNENIICSNEKLGKSFNYLPYLKGSLMLLMLENLVSEENLRKGLVSYLNQMSYSSADESTFWKIIEKTITNEAGSFLPENKSLEDIMHSWTHNVGYPIIHIYRNNSEIYVKQTASSENSSLFWWIPLTFTTSNKQNFNDTQVKHWIKPNKDLQKLNIELDENEWIIINIQRVGYYRVNYDIKTWNQLGDYLQIEKNINRIHPLNRAFLLDDCNNLMQMNLTDKITCRPFLKYLINETHYYPWKIATDILVDHIVSYNYRQLNNSHSIAKRALQILMNNIMEQVTRDNKSKKQLDILLRSLIISSACSDAVDHPLCFNYTTAVLPKLMSLNATDISDMIDVYGELICLAAKYGFEQFHNFIIESLENFPYNVPLEKNILLIYYTKCSRNHTNNKKIYRWLLNAYFDDKYNVTYSVLRSRIKSLNKYKLCELMEVLQDLQNLHSTNDTKMTKLLADLELWKFIFEESHTECQTTINQTVNIFKIDLEKVNAVKLTFAKESIRGNKGLNPNMYFFHLNEILSSLF